MGLELYYKTYQNNNIKKQAVCNMGNNNLINVQYLYSETARSLHVYICKFST